MCARSLAPVRILVADQHRIVRAGIKTLLMETRSWQRFEVEEAETTEEAISMLSAGQFNVVLMEYGLPGKGGIKATEIILSRWPGTHVLAVCDTDDVGVVERMVRVGAGGCILRNIGVEVLVFAIRTVMAGKKFYSNEIALRLMERQAIRERDPLERLTAREREVFRAILEGFGGKEIAFRMGIGKRTVDKHRQHINYKLGTSSPLELIQAGLRFGLVSLPQRMDIP